MKLQKTEAGHQAFKQRSPDISARQRSAFILFDGQRLLDEVLVSTAGLGVTRADILDLVDKGFLQAPAEAAGMAAVSPPATAPGMAPGSTPQPSGVDAPAQASVAAPASSTPAERYQAAYPIAIRITAKLGLRGFKLNLSVEGASGYDDLVALVPAIAKACNPEDVRELRRALHIE